jgi:hypothetical protein
MAIGYRLSKMCDLRVVKLSPMDYFPLAFYAVLAIVFANIAVALWVLLRGWRIERPRRPR